MTARACSLPLWFSRALPRIIAASLLLCLAGNSAAVSNSGGSWEWRGRLQHRYGVDMHDTSTAVLNDTLLDGELKYRYGPDWQLDTILRARHEDRLQDHSYQDLSLREFIIDHQAEDYSLHLGRQQVVWGKTDGLRLLDVVNPLDLREFVLDQYSDSRIPLWMANVEWFGAQDSVQALIIPDTTVHHLATEDSRFYIGPDVPAGLQVTSQPVKEPPTTVDNWQYGLKWAGQRGGWDLTLNALYGWNQTPVYFYQQTGALSLELQPEIRRRRTFGASGDLPLGHTVLRFEVAFSPDEYLMVADPTAERGYRRQNQLSVAMGLDWTLNNWLISPQWFQERLINPDANVQGVQSKDYVTLLVNRKFLQDRLEFRAFYLYGPANHEQWFAPALSYQIAGRYEFSLKADIFQGPSNTLFGQFSANDRLVLGLKIYI